MNSSRELRQQLGSARGEAAQEQEQKAALLSQGAHLRHGLLHDAVQARLGRVRKLSTPAWSGACRPWGPPALPWAA